MANKDYYKILGVSQSASQDEIKSVYRKLAKKYHPDMNPSDRKGAETKFKELSEAYYVLGDQKRKQEYNDMMSGRTYTRQRQAYNPAQGFDFEDLLSHLGFSPGTRTSSRTYRNYGMFDDMFSQGVEQAENDVNTDIDANTEIPASVAKTGGELKVNIGGKNVSVRIPPNTASGTRLRLKGLGHSCPHCRKHGDLFIRVRVV